jgi:hypothetical protein
MQFPPIRIFMKMDTEISCYGDIFKQVLAISDGESKIQMWVKFDDNTFESRYILDPTILDFKVVHRTRAVDEPPLFPRL